jgi:hypothetical protein
MRTASAACIGRRHETILQGRRRRQSGDGMDFLFIEGFPFQQDAHQCIERLAVLALQAHGFGMALVDDSLDFEVPRLARIR